MTKKTFLATFILLCISNLLVFSQTAENYLQTFTSGGFRAKSPANVTPMNDGERYAYISKDKKQILATYYNSDKEEVIFDADKVLNCPVKEIMGFEFDKGETRILLHSEVEMIYRRSFTTDYYVYDIKRNKIEPVSNNGAQQMAAFSPNGRIIAFARDNNLFLKKLDFNTESQITKDGKKNEIINGTPDWVYEEEFTNIRYFEFSPDSKLLAFVRFDEKEVGEFSFQWFNDSYPVLKIFKYPKAGTANSKVSVWVYDVENRTTNKMQISGEDFYIPTMKWTSTSDALAVVRLSRNQKQIDLLSINPRSGISTTLYSENSKTYSDYRNFDAIRFNSDNSFVLMSEKDGYRHIYLHEPNGLVKQQLTKGDWDVINFYGYDEKEKTAYFQAAKEVPTERNIYKSVNGKISCLDNRKGIHKANFSNNFRYAIHSFENTTTPNIYSIINNSGKIIRKIEENNELAQKIKEFNLPKKEFFTFKTSEGILLNGWIVKPAKTATGQKFPLVLTQYSGPDSQEVLNRWSCDWEYYLVMNGFAVACVDGRGTGARGRDFRTCTYGQLGILEAKDQIETANYLKNNDKDINSNIAIWGWSYGGFITLECMTSENSPFKAGITIAPVTDWRLYNTAYTERFMNRPQENFDGYDITSNLKRAANLKGNLLLIHATADDNVHTQNSYLMAEKLVEAGIQFDMQIYTNKNHSILGSKARYNLYKRCTEFLQSKLF